MNAPVSDGDVEVGMPDHDGAAEPVAANKRVEPPMEQKNNAPLRLLQRGSNLLMRYEQQESRDETPANVQDGNEKLANAREEPGESASVGDQGGESILARHLPAIDEGV